MNFTEKVRIFFDISILIRLLRRNKGYTQQEFSEILGLSTNYLSDVERGKSFPRLDKLIAIMNTLECSADDIFEDVITSGYRNKESKLSDKIEKLSDKNKMLVFDVLDTLLNNLE